MVNKADEALTGERPRSIWRRLPVLPGLLGRMLIRSQTPDAKRKFKAPTGAQPAASNVAPDILRRFVEQQRDFAARLQTLDEKRAGRTIMSSPASISFLVIWTLFLLGFWALGLPLGLQAPYTYPS